MKQSTTPTAAPETNHGHQALSGYIKARFDEFSRSQKDVAQYIVDHLDEAAFQTAEELARRANTSSSTVVRFSQALGFEGFPELQQAARDEYRRRVGQGGVATETLAAATPLFSLDHTEFEAALAADHVNVEDTAHKLSRSDVEAAVDAIVSAEKVLIAGHRPDGVLRQLPASPADAARPPRRDRGQPLPGGAGPAEPDRRQARSSSASRPGGRIRSSPAR